MTNRPDRSGAVKSDPEPVRSADTALGNKGHVAGIDLVVAGYDGSHEAALGVRWAAEIAQQSSASLRVVWAWRMRDVWDEAVAARDGIELPPMAELEDVARRRLTGVVSALVAGIVSDVDIRLARGPDAANILLDAAADADVLVVGSRGRSRVANALLGSVSARCIHESICPVLVIPHQMAAAGGDHFDPRTVQAEIVARRATTIGD